MPGPACCLLAAFLSSAVVEAAAGADGEVAAGRAPIDLVGPEKNSVTFTLTPGAAVRVRSLTDTLTLAYTPRIFYRVPNSLEVSRPLVLHQVSLDHTVELSRRLTVASSAGLSVGEIDYTASSLVFAPGSSAVRSSVADIVRAEGQTGFKLEVTRRLRWTVDASAEYTTPIGDSGTITGLPDGTPLPEGVSLGALPESAQFSARSSLSYAVTRTDRLAANGEITYQWFPDTGRFLLFSPDISWDKNISRRTTMTLRGGVAYVVTLETPEGAEDQANAFGGTGGFQMTTMLYKTRKTSLNGSFNASLDWFFDPVAGTSQPRAGVDIGTDLLIGREWQISPSASFYAVLRDDNPTTLGVPPIQTPGGTDAPIPIDAVVIDSDNTVLRAEIPFRYALTRSVSFTFGTRASLRGNSITQDGFKLDQRTEYWVFAGLTVRFAAGRDYGSWLTL